MRPILSRLFSDFSTSGMWLVETPEHHFLLINASDGYTRAMIKTRLSEEEWDVGGWRLCPWGANEDSSLQEEAISSAAWWLKDKNLDRPFSTRRQALDAIRVVLAREGLP